MCRRGKLVSIWQLQEGGGGALTLTNLDVWQILDTDDFRPHKVKI
jgi:hypothetical protein